jgi:hypothetical protein
MYLASSVGITSEKEASTGEKVLHSWASSRPVPVFNACDLEGDPLAGFLSAWPVPASWGGERAFYSTSFDCIQLRAPP